MYHNCKLILSFSTPTIIHALAYFSVDFTYQIISSVFSLGVLGTPDDFF